MTLDSSGLFYVLCLTACWIFSNQLVRLLRKPLMRAFLCRVVLVPLGTILMGINVKNEVINLR